MNSLHREIEKGEVVVVSKRYHRDSYQELKYRVVVVNGGFGMSDITMGTALAVKYLCDGEETRIEGYMLSPTETETYQAKHGKFLKPVEES